MLTIPRLLPAALPWATELLPLSGLLNEYLLIILFVDDEAIFPIRETKTPAMEQ